MTTVLETIFQYRKYKAVFGIAFAGIVVLFVAIPVLTIPANTLRFQLSIYQPRDYALLGVFAALTALLITMQWYLVGLKRRAQEAARASGRGIVGSSSAVFAALFGTAACSSCVAAILGIFGIGAATTITLLTYRWYIVLGSLLLIVLVLRSTAREINSTGSACCVPASASSISQGGLPAGGGTTQTSSSLVTASLIVAAAIIVGATLMAK